MKIITILGSRPQFIKAAVVSRAVASYNHQHPQKSIEEVLVHTGQHYDYNMSDIFFAEMQIPAPSYHLGIGNCSHGQMTGRMLEKIEQVIIDEKPKIVLVYGDTNSTLAGALAASKQHIPVAHVEAGLRSFNMKMPEEVNRVLTDHISQWLFCPTDTAVKNLEREGFIDRKSALISEVGDVMYDASLIYREIAKPTEAIENLLQSLSDNFYLATVHRAENTDDTLRLSNIIEALNTISQTTPIVLPLHPRTRQKLGNTSTSHIKLTEPVGYFDMITLLSKCKAVFTDSGGLQKEAYFFKTPCITLRDETEWIELVDQGFNVLAGADKDTILNRAKNLKFMKKNWEPGLYGDGKAGKKIVEILAQSN